LASVARRDHTVPPFYLEGFAEQGLIGTVRLPGEQRFTQSTGRASTQTDFYATPELVDGTDTFEKVLSEIEGLAANAIKKIISERTWPLDPETRGALAMFLAIQFLRGPDQRRAMKQVIAHMTQLEWATAVGRWSKFGQHRGTVSSRRLRRPIRSGKMPCGRAGLLSACMPSATSSRSSASSRRSSHTLLDAHGCLSSLNESRSSRATRL
jgi:hypothetical protein